MKKLYCYECHSSVADNEEDLIEHYMDIHKYPEEDAGIEASDEVDNYENNTLFSKGELDRQRKADYDARAEEEMAMRSYENGEDVFG